MGTFFNLVIGGAAAGAIYSLIAAGLVVTYTSTGVFNLSYAGIAFVSAYVYYELHIGLNWSIAEAAIVVIFVMAPLLGLFLERVIFRRLQDSGQSAKVTATIGLLIALPAIALFIVTGGITTFHWNIPSGLNVYLAPGIGPSPEVVWKLPGGLRLNSDEVIVLGVASLCALGLWLLLRHTSFGLRMRAVVDSPRQAQLSGVNAERIPMVAWMIGTMLAALAGVVAAPIFNSLDPSVYITTVFVAAAAVVLGKFRSIPWAFAGGLILGIIQNLVGGYATFARGIPGFGDSVPFAVLLIGLVVLGRDRTRSAGSVNTSAEATVHEDATAMWRRWTPRRMMTTGLVVAAYLVYISLVASNYWVQANILGLSLSLAFLSFIVITGMGGMLNLAPASFVMASGLTVGVMIDRFHFPWFPAVIVAVLVAVIIGIVVALPAIRLGGLALALATLALAFVGDNVLFNWSWFINNPTGWVIHRPSIGGIGLSSDRVLAIFLVVVIALAFVVIINLHRSPSGRAMFAVRNSQAGASTSGVSPVRVKLLIFVFGAAIAGLGGALLATFNGAVTGGQYTATTGLTWFAGVVLWGVRRPGSAVAAGLSSALFSTFLLTGIHFPSWVPSWLSWNGTSSIYIPAILFGLGAVQMAKEPDGIFRMFEKQRVQKQGRKALKAQTRLAVAGPALDGGADIQATTITPAPTPAAATTPSSTAPAANGIGQSFFGAGDVETPVLAVEGLCAGYGELKVLFDVDLVVPKGSITALVGANGAGKSTLCSVIAGLVPATKGTVVLDGVDVTSKPVFRRVKDGLVLTPESRGIFPGLTVEENLAIRLDATLRKMTYDRFPQIAARRNTLAGNLSGGEQQILALAPVLATSPKLLVADEPTLGLAPLIVDSLLEFFDELRSAGTSILLVEEKARSILDVTDYVVLFELGRVVWKGPASEVNADHLAASYFAGEDPRAKVVAPAAPLLGANER
jgi:ABC-type branched-subunit amino acid transport system ATPase component/branched-subunit amino acid ABC-type transport system permease component